MVKIVSRTAVRSSGTKAQLSLTSRCNCQAIGGQTTKWVISVVCVCMCVCRERKLSHGNNRLGEFGYKRMRL